MVASLSGASGAGALEQSVADAIAARNPTLAELRDQDPSAFQAAVELIAEAQTSAGLDPADPPPDSRPVARGAAPDVGREFTPGNPDVLWLYNSAPEGMHDLISLLKSAGQKPKT